VVGCPRTTHTQTPYERRDDRLFVITPVCNHWKLARQVRCDEQIMNYKRTCPISDGSVYIEMGRSEQRNAALPARLLVSPSKFLPLMPLLGCTTFHPHATMVENI
jgi:hypothetical protein